MDLRQFYRHHSLLFGFFLRIALLLTAGLALLLWLKSIPGLQLKIVNSTPVYYFSKTFIAISHQLISLFGYEGHTDFFRLENMEFVAALCTPWNDCLYLAWPCFGVKVTAVFIALIIVFPGESRHKWWYIPVGILLIQVFNILRFSGLMMIAFHYPIELITNFNMGSLGIGYHEIFNLVLYLVIFALFVAWIKIFGLTALLRAIKKKDEPT